jgi:hypothetical protein
MPIVEGRADAPPLYVFRHGSAELGEVGGKLTGC